MLGGAGIVLVLAILPDGFTYGTPGLLLVIMYACGATRLLLGAASTACLAIIVFANAILLYKGASGFQFLNTNVFLVSASLIGLSYTALLEWMERLAFRLEEGLREDKKVSETMLRNFLPDRIMSRVRNGECAIAEAVGEATVLFADIVGFTSLTHRMAPGHVVEMLSTLFNKLDEIADSKGVDKVKTIGDCYMAVAGVRSPSSQSAEAMAEFAIEALAFVHAYAEEYDIPLQVRIGMSTGSIVSGVIGTRVPIFDLWGGPVNDASRLQQEGVPGAIQVTESTYWRLRNRYEFEERGTLTLKHGEQLNAFLLTGRKVAAGAGPRLVSGASRDLGASEAVTGQVMAILSSLVSVGSLPANQGRRFGKLNPDYREVVDETVALLHHYKARLQHLQRIDASAPYLEDQIQGITHDLWVDWRTAWSDAAQCLCEIAGDKDHLRAAKDYTESQLTTELMGAPLWLQAYASRSATRVIIR